MSSTRALLLLSAVLMTTTSVPARSQSAEQQVYRGICDASAAVSLGPRHFVVGDDEVNVLNIYEIGKPERVGQADLNAFLEVGKDDDGWLEADIEGAARIGQRIYWISSHGRDSDGLLEANRYRFFATDLSGNGQLPQLKTTGTPYKSLLDDLLADTRFAKFDLKDAAGKAPESLDGLSIEGLAATPEGGLLIGFRNPRRDDWALIVPFLNPAAVIERGEKPRFGDALRPDLEGRGIRSIERVGDGYLISAGPFGDDATGEAATFALYRWAGGHARPEKLKDIPLIGRPEALFTLEDGRLALLSDDGDERVDGRKCKNKKTPVEKKSFRASIITTPAQK